MNKILITGSSGFIGYHLATKLLKDSDVQVVGVDNMNNYYDIGLKKDRLKRLQEYKNFHFEEIDISDQQLVDNIFNQNSFSCVINLAAQAGVRYARKNPYSYMTSNINGFYNIISASSKYNVEKLLYASSSSVYGASTKIPFKEAEAVSTPMSLYAATKVANESIASAFFYTEGIKTIGMRFFNVYGPWGRPDMAYYKWADALIKGEELELRDNGEMWRDMTYVDDVIHSIYKLIQLDTSSLSEPKILNIGNRSPVKISDMLEFISEELNTTPIIKHTARGSEEPIKTWADTSSLFDLIGFAPDTDYKIGLKRFLDWYQSYYL